MKARLSQLTFIGRMAWRDSRASRHRLLLFALCIVVGIAALVAIGSFGRSLQVAVAQQAKALLGADLAMGSRVRFTSEHEDFLRSLGGEQAREISFSTMVSFPRSGGTRLVQVRALEGDFPFYGRLEAIPDDADMRFRHEGGVLVEEALLLQYDSRPGDEVRIGQLKTRVIGALQRVPGESVAFATIAPRIYLRMQDLEATGLLRSGSLARYRVLFRFPEGTDVQGLVARNRGEINRLRLSVTTVDERREDLGQAMRNLYHYLNLVGFVALLLGGVGIASAIQVHVKQKLPTVAMLRCLGCSIWTAFGIYLLQAIALGTVGATLGAIAGVLVQHALPRVVADFLPFRLQVHTAWEAIGEAALLGFLMCVLFALLPLAAIRRVSPLEVLRVAYEPQRRWDRFQIGVVIVLGAVIVAFALNHSQRWQEGVGFAGGLFAAFGILTLVARMAIAGAKRLRLVQSPFVLRQGLASLHRPNNRTLLLVVSLGLGTFLLLTLRLTQTTLMQELVSGRESGRANAILFDIQADQLPGVTSLVRQQNLPIIDQAPIISMRLRSIQQRPIEAILGDSGGRPPRWTLRREYRSTFTDTLRDSEKIIAGEWIPEVAPDAEPIPVSLEEGIAKELGVGLGDELEWDIQGIGIRTRVASLRQVDWRRVQPNFFVLFPRGPLDEAPAVHVIVTRVETAAQSARLQRAVVDQYPNVSAIDITLVLRTLDQVLGKIAFVIRFMALFTVGTGLVVLVATVLSGRFQRVRESILLRVLGASRKQVLRVLLIEYATLGLLAAVSGVILAGLASAALAWFVFKLPFVPSFWPPVIAIVMVTLLTMLTGLVASRGITTHPPLEILRDLR